MTSKTSTKAYPAENYAREIALEMIRLTNQLTNMTKNGGVRRGVSPHKGQVNDRGDVKFQKAMETKERAMNKIRSLPIIHKYDWKIGRAHV
jgi:hypothetical protein